MNIVSIPEESMGQIARHPPRSYLTFKTGMEDDVVFTARTAMRDAVLHPSPCTAVHHMGTALALCYQFTAARAHDARLIRPDLSFC